MRLYSAGGKEPTRPIMTKILQHTYGQVDVAFSKRAARLPEAEDGPIWMVNFMAYKKKAVYDGVEVEIDGKEADNRYNPIAVLHKIGASLSFVGDVIGQSPNHQPKWDRIAVVKYPTRRSFVEMGARKDFQEKHVHKQAGMDQTIVCGCLPVEGALESLRQASPSDASADAQSEVGSGITMLHIVRFEESAQDQAQPYAIDLCRIGVAHGGQIDAIMESETTFLGDGRRWDQVIMITYPSQEACGAAQVAAQGNSEHQALYGAAIADRYDVAAQILINEIRQSQNDTGAQSSA